MSERFDTFDQRTQVTGPTPVSARASGPDMARGLLLLFIALANAHTFLHWPGTTTVRAMPVAQEPVDRAVAGLLTTVVDGRSYTMFAALFGYGMVQVMRRHERRGLDWPDTRRVLRRRGRWLYVFGFLHATLLFYGDILAAYGLLAIILAPRLCLPNRRLMAHCAGWTALGSAIYGLYSWPSTSVMPWLTEESPFVAATMRAGGVLVSSPLLATTAAGSALLGIWAARHRVLEQPELYGAALRRFALVGIAVSVVGGLPLALLIASGGEAGPGLAVPLATLHALSGCAGGPAYAVVVALFVTRYRSAADHPFGLAIRATGQRSLTCYVAQSFVWQLAFAPYLFDLGRNLPLWKGSLLATSTWFTTVVLAEWMRRTGRRGPLESLLRKLTYR